MNRAMKNSIRIHWLALIFLFSIFFLFTNLSPFVSASACQESWSCGEWNKCFDNVTTRYCFDISNCGTSFSIPQIKSDCSDIFKDCFNGITDNDETDMDCGGSQCTSCLEGQYCLSDQDCDTLYCQKSKCAIIPEYGQPAIKIPSPLFAYWIFFFLSMTAIAIILIVNNINKSFEYSPEKFNLNLNSYVEKKIANREKEIDEEIDLEASLPAKEVKKLEREIKQIEKKEKKAESKEVKKKAEAKKEVKFEIKKLKKEDKERITSERKQAILNGMKDVYEDSYE